MISENVKALIAIIVGVVAIAGTMRGLAVGWMDSRYVTKAYLSITLGDLEDYFDANLIRTRRQTLEDRIDELTTNKQLGYADKADRAQLTLYREKLKRTYHQ